jgi:rod shape-determining protein MreD
MAVLIAVPILAILLILQTAVVNQIPLLQGSADLVLLALIAWASQKRVQSAWIWGIIGGLLVGFVSAVPIPVYIIAYLIAVAFAILLRQRIWNVPILAMLISTFAGTLILYGTTMVALRLLNTPLAIGLSINLIVLPSLLLNMLLALPFFLIFGDLASLLYPESLEM